MCNCGPASAGDSLENSVASSVVTRLLPLEDTRAGRQTLSVACTRRTCETLEAVHERLRKRADSVRVAANCNSVERARSLLVVKSMDCCLKKQTIGFADRTPTPL